MSPRALPLAALALAALLALGLVVRGGDRAPEIPVATRLLDAPIVTPAMLPGADGANIDGPSLIRVPDWLPGRLGRYYLYFAHHDGGYIRLAYADSLTGPWRVHAAGTLRLEQTACDQPSQGGTQGHVASPDVHVDEEAREIRMYFHCPVWFTSQAECPRERDQVTFVARSPDGIHFAADEEPLGQPYFRVFRWQGDWYALGQPGVLYRSRDGLGGFARGPALIEPSMRHAAVSLRGDVLHVFYTRAGDAPERILVRRIPLRGDWLAWKADPPRLVLAPERLWEGAGLPRLPSQRGAVGFAANQLRDPAVFESGGASYLLYAIAGEQGIAIAGLEWRADLRVSR